MKTRDLTCFRGFDDQQFAIENGDFDHHLLAELAIFHMLIFQFAKC